MGDRKLGRTTDQRRALYRALATSLFLHGRIRTTAAKAQELRGVADRLITVAKRDDLAARRRVLAFLTDEDVAKKLFEQIAPRYRERSGGYTRVYKTGPRRGDAASMAIVELV